MNRHLFVRTTFGVALVIAAAVTVASVAAQNPLTIDKARITIARHLERSRLHGHDRGCKGDARAVCE